MAEVTLTRFFDADIARVFAYVTERERLLEWWGPEGVTVPVHALDFSRPGPWFSEMHNDKGDIFKVSGEVVRVDPPRSVEITWAWHDETGARGHESRVRIDLEARDGGTTFTLNHSMLADEDAATQHTMGWTSSLRKLAGAVDGGAKAAG